MQMGLLPEARGHSAGALTCIAQSIFCATEDDCPFPLLLLLLVPPPPSPSTSALSTLQYPADAHPATVQRLSLSLTDRPSAVNSLQYSCELLTAAAVVTSTADGYN